MDYAIFPPEELIEDAVVEMPLSKSIANRALVLAAMTDGAPRPKCPDCADTLMLAAALDTLAALRPDDPTPEIDLGINGTAMRFLTGFVASRPGCRAVLTGPERMRQRPVGALVTALRECGADIEYLGEEGFPPLKIHGRKLAGGTVKVDATVSSQFVSSLLMAAPLMTDGLTIELDGEPVSAPYIAMTLNMMDARGVPSDRSPLSVSVPPARYTRPATDDAEGCWSTAAFFYEITALTAGWITLKGLKADSLQGDRMAADYFGRLGIVTAPSEECHGALDLQPSPEVYGRLDLDLTDTPDMAPALVASCCLTGVPFKFIGLQGLAIKECDRLSALVEEMDRIGCTVERIRDFGLEWEGKRHPITQVPVFDPHGDHRLAMALAPTAVFIPGTVVRDAGCVDKSYPGYWEALRSLGFTIREVERHPSGEAEASATQTTDSEEEAPEEVNR